MTRDDGFEIDEHAHPVTCPADGCENLATAVGTVESGGVRMKAVRPCAPCMTRVPVADPRRPRSKAHPPTVGHASLFVYPEGSKSTEAKQPLDRLKFAQGFAKLCRRHRRKVDDGDMIDGYYQRLRGNVTPEQMRSGLDKAFNATRHFPTPDELLAMCVGTWSHRPERGRWS